MTTTIKIRVRGGVVQDVSLLPPGISVVVYDYDGQSDDEGKPCDVMIWGPPVPTGPQS